MVGSVCVRVVGSVCVRVVGSVCVCVCEWWVVYVCHVSEYMHVHSAVIMCCDVC